MRNIPEGQPPTDSALMGRALPTPPPSLPRSESLPHLFPTVSPDGRATRETQDGCMSGGIDGWMDRDTERQSSHPWSSPS